MQLGLPKSAPPRTSACPCCTGGVGQSRPFPWSWWEGRLPERKDFSASSRSTSWVTSRPALPTSVASSIKPGQGSHSPFEVTESLPRVTRKQPVPTQVPHKCQEAALLQALDSPGWRPRSHPPEARRAVGLSCWAAASCYMVRHSCTWWGGHLQLSTLQQDPCLDSG